MEALQRELNLIISDWCSFVGNETVPHAGFSVYDNITCKCEMHRWDILFAGFIPRHADLFMGVYYESTAKAPIDVEMFIGGYPVCRMHIQPGEKTLAFEGVTFISMLNLDYHDVKMRPSCLEAAQHLHLIYANLSWEPRRLMATTDVFFSTPEHCRSTRTRTYPVLRYFSGMGGLVEHEPDAWVNAIALPEFPDPQIKLMTEARKRQAACRRQLDHFKEELIRTAWHPCRHLSWCLDTEDVEDLQVDVPICGTGFLWYDEILIVSSVEEPVNVPRNMKCISHHEVDRFFCCLHSDGRTCLKVKGKAGRWLAFDPPKPFWTRDQSQQICTPC